MFGIYVLCISQISIIINTSTFRFYRNTNQPSAYHGQTRVGSLHSLQVGRPERWHRRGDHKKIVAGDNSRPGLTPFHNECRIYIAHTVSAYYVILLPVYVK